VTESIKRNDYYVPGLFPSELNLKQHEVRDLETFPLERREEKTLHLGKINENFL